MTIIQALILGIVQGLTEFLPISSSGHLILVPYLLGWDIQDLEFDIALHLGTAFAIIITFWNDWKTMFLAGYKDTVGFVSKKNNKLSDEFKLLITIFLVCIPVGIVGLLFEDSISTIFRSPYVVAIMMIIISLLMLFADRYHSKLSEDKVIGNLYKVGFINTLIISLSQIIALIPGSSRSGSTISFGLFRNLSRENAARISFLLGTPIILGAGLLQIGDLMNLDTDKVLPYFVGFIASFITGFLVIKWLMKYLKTNNLTLFIIYRIIIAFVIIFIFTLGK